MPITTKNTTERYITAKDIKNRPKKFSNFAHFRQIATKWVKNFYVNKKYICKRECALKYAKIIIQ